jgi:hypothetical protein
MSAELVFKDGEGGDVKYEKRWYVRKRDDDMLGFKVQKYE